MPADFKMYAGDTKILDVVVKDSNGFPVDLTGTAVRWQLGKSATARPPLVQKSVGNGITLADAANGRFEVTLSAADTQALRGSYYHEAEVDDLGTIATVLAGKVQIDAALIDP